MQSVSHVPQDRKILSYQADPAMLFFQTFTGIFPGRVI